MFAKWYNNNFLTNSVPIVTSINYLPDLLRIFLECCKIIFPRRFPSICDCFAGCKDNLEKARRDKFIVKYFYWCFACPYNFEPLKIHTYILYNFKCSNVSYFSFHKLPQSSLLTCVEAESFCECS